MHDPHISRVNTRLAAVLIAALWAALLVHPVACRADQFALLETNAAAMQARVDLIQQAEHEICLAYYAADLGVVPVATMELLRQAAGRGVAVRLIVDGLISRVPSDLEAYLRQCGIQIRVYHAPWTGQTDCFNRRMHAKCMIIDSRHVIMGSRNLKDEHFGIDQQNYIDCDAYAAGSIGTKAQRYFDWLWRQPDLDEAPTADSFKMDILRTRPSGDTAWERQWRTADSNSDYQRLLTQSLSELRHRLPIQYHSGNDWTAASISVSCIRLLNDRYTDKRELFFQQQIVSLVEGADRSILIETPYPVFTPAVRHSLLAASRRGVAVTVLTNSLHTTDRPFAYAAYQNDKRQLLTAGVQLYEISGPDHFHAKSMVIDAKVFTLGSYNFDPRSSRSNLELNLIGCDESVAAWMQQSIERRMRGATRVRIDYLTVGVGPDATLIDRARMQSARLVVGAIRWLL